MIDSDGPGGAEAMIFRLAEDLRRRGDEVVPVAPRRGTGWLGALYRNAGFSIEDWWLDRPPLDPRGVWRLAKFFRAQKVDVVHSHEFTMAVYGCAATRIVGLPHVITIHGGVGVCAVLRRRMALRWAMRNSEHTVMVSRATARQYGSELGLPENNFVVVPNGVPVHIGDAAAVRREFEVRDDELVILAVGNLEPHKGHRVLIDALALLDERGVPPRWRLIIAGGRGGREHQSLLEQIRSRRLEERVQIATGRSDVPDLLALSDIYAMPSLVEGLPMALLEAMVAEKPIVASITAGIPEAIVDRRDGLLVPPGDVGALADALALLLTDRKLRERLAIASGARGRTEFTVDVMANRYREIYDSAAVKRNARPVDRVGGRGRDSAA